MVAEICNFSGNTTKIVDKPKKKIMFFVLIATLAILNEMLNDDRLENTLTYVIFYKDSE